MEVATLHCNACNLQIGLSNRGVHYRSDLHCVNLKRRVAGLAPLSEGVFAARVAALPKETEKNQRQFCVVCNKKFSSQKALENHEKSRRHQDKLRNSSESDYVSDVGTSTMGGSTTGEVEMDLDMELELRLERHLNRIEGGFSGIFDWSVHKTAEDVLTYCANTYGFIVPFVERLTDHVGLVKYLGQKTHVGFACVKCDKGFDSFEACRKHMKDRNHCCMTDDEEKWLDEYWEFYDFDEEDTGIEDEEEEENAGELEFSALVVGNKVLGHRQYLRYYKQGAGRSVDTRDCVLANQSLKTVKVGGWGHWKGRLELKSKQRERRQQHGFELRVGSKNYYTRKARFKQKMAVFNSGYRA